jgi:acetolactate synthase-1/2/3 large subunit
MAACKASDLFVQCLEAEGVTRIFGVPGEENADLMFSIESSSIDFVLTRHEQGAAFMADVHGRLTGEPGVCLGTLGPGAANLVTGVADANMDRAPLVVITGQADSRRLHKESHQNMDVVGMFEPITKWAWSLVNPAPGTRSGVPSGRSSSPATERFENVRVSSCGVSSRAPASGCSARSWRRAASIATIRTACSRSVSRRAT